MAESLEGSDGKTTEFGQELLDFVKKHLIDKSDAVIHVNCHGRIWRMSKANWLKVLQIHADGLMFSLKDYGEPITNYDYDISAMTHEQARRLLEKV